MELSTLLETSLQKRSLELTERLATYVNLQFQSKIRGLIATSVLPQIVVSTGDLGARIDHWIDRQNLRKIP